MDILSNFSERLAELMFFHDEMSSEELAKRTGIAGSSIRAWLRKETVPSYDKLIAVADFFCCSLDFWRDGATWMNGSSRGSCRPSIPICGN